MEEVAEYLEIARAMTDAARVAGFFDNTLEVIPEICETEKRFFIALIFELKRLEKDELSQDEIYAIFNFISAASGSAVSSWHANIKVEFNFDDILNAEAGISADEAVIMELRRSEVAQIMADAFLGIGEKDITEITADPMLALLEALKWNWRITAHLSVGALGGNE